MRLYPTFQPSSPQSNFVKYNFNLFIPLLHSQYLRPHSVAWVCSHKGLGLSGMAVCCCCRLKNPLKVSVDEARRTWLLYLYQMCCVARCRMLQGLDFCIQNSSSPHSLDPLCIFSPTSPGKILTSAVSQFSSNVEMLALELLTKAGDCLICFFMLKF